MHTTYGVNDSPKVFCKKHESFYHKEEGCEWCVPLMEEWKYQREEQNEVLSFEDFLRNLPF